MSCARWSCLTRRSDEDAQDGTSGTIAQLEDSLLVEFGDRQLAGPMFVDLCYFAADSVVFLLEPKRMCMLKLRVWMLCTERV
jgi:hypothetical protein